MTRYRVIRSGRVLSACLLAGAAAWPALGSGLTPGNILVSNTKFGGDPPMLYEFTPGGVLVQEIDLPNNGGGRDVVLDSGGLVQVYNGTFDPILSAYDPVAGTFAERTMAGWSTVNNLTYGGLTAVGPYVFATDMSTANDGAPQGIIRFGPDGEERFATDIQPIDVTAGLDGYLYALSRGSAFNGGGNRVDVYDPATMQFVRTFMLPNQHRAIAVDTNGDIFTADDINRYDANVVFIDTIEDPLGGLGDIDIAYDGTVILASHGGSIMVTDTAFSSSFDFVSRDGTSFTFAAFVQPPPNLRGDLDGDGYVGAADLDLVLAY